MFQDEESNKYWRFFVCKMSKTYCIRCKQYTTNKNQKISRTNNGITVISAYCYDFNDKNNRLIKEQEAKGLLSHIRLKNTFK